MTNRFTAIVIKSTGSWYTVLDPDSGTRSECRIRGVLRLKGSRSTNPVVVGDHVVVESSLQGDDAAITEILQRKNYIIRRSSNLSKESHIIAANIDKLYLTATIDFPHTSPEFVDRVLVTAEAYKIPVTILINKCDLLNTDEQQNALQRFKEIYHLAGYPTCEISATTLAGIDTLREELRGQISLFTGNSGVGKSTLINAIDPTLNARTGNISSYHNRGKHTTTFSEIFPLQSGGFLIDTPGIKGFGLVDIDPHELSHYFPEMLRFSQDCQYYNCTHIHEPNCAVMQAVAQGAISESRYESYLKMLDEDNVKYRR